MKSCEIPLSFDIQPINKCGHLSFINSCSQNPATSHFPANGPLVPAPAGTWSVTAFCPSQVEAKSLQWSHNTLILHDRPPTPTLATRSISLTLLNKGATLPKFYAISKFLKKLKIKLPYDPLIPLWETGKRMENGISK